MSRNEPLVIVIGGPCELKMHCFVIQVITNVDIQSIEPVDQQMRDSLSKSVQMAIEISTKYG